MRAQLAHCSFLSAHSPTTSSTTLPYLHIWHVLRQSVSITGASPHPLRLARASEAQSSRRSTHPPTRLGPAASRSAWARARSSRSTGAGQSCCISWTLVTPSEQQY